MDLSTYIIIFFILLFLISGIFVVKQQTSAIIERFGKFIAIRRPGLHFKIPIITLNRLIHFLNLCQAKFPVRL